MKLLTGLIVAWSALAWETWAVPQSNDVSGTWSVRITWSDDTPRSNAACTLKEDAKRELSGECKTAGPDGNEIVIPVLSGSVSGRRVVWQLGNEGLNGGMRLAEFSGELETATTLSGQVEFGPRKGRFAAQKD